MKGEDAFDGIGLESERLTLGSGIIIFLWPPLDMIRGAILWKGRLPAIDSCTIPI